MVVYRYNITAAFSSSYDYWFLLSGNSIKIVCFWIIAVGGIGAADRGNRNFLFFTSTRALFWVQSSLGSPCQLITGVHCSLRINGPLLLESALFTSCVTIPSLTPLHSLLLVNLAINTVWFILHFVCCLSGIGYCDDTPYWNSAMISYHSTMSVLSMTGVLLVSMQVKIFVLISKRDCQRLYGWCA